MPMRSDGYWYKLFKAPRAANEVDPRWPRLCGEGGGGAAGKAGCVMSCSSPLSSLLPSFFFRLVFSVCLLIIALSPCSLNDDALGGSDLKNCISPSAGELSSCPLGCGRDATHLTGGCITTSNGFCSRSFLPMADLLFLALLLAISREDGACQNIPKDGHRKRINQLPSAGKVATPKRQPNVPLRRGLIRRNNPPE